MTVAIIDYGSGNLRSAAKAFERAIAEIKSSETVVVTEDSDIVAAADRIVLPGVGAYADCKAGLSSVPGMAEALKSAVQEKARPFLGICVGMQLMADRGLEHEVTEGFGWIAGEVCALKPSDQTLKIPHMGWNTITFPGSRHPVLEGLSEGAHAYFVHSYRFACADPKDVAAEADYGGRFTAAVARENMIGTQFHPEKSQATGLKLIENFLTWAP